jgi:hypothetical protein
MAKLKIYKIWQEEHNDWDTYDSAIVCAESEEEAKRMRLSIEERDLKELYPNCQYASWVIPEMVKVEYIGEAKEGLKKGVIVASYNAG